MTNLICDDAEEWEDAAIPRPRPWRPKDNLSPEPPRGWVIAMKFYFVTGPLDIGCWIVLLFEAQQASKTHGMKCYTVARGEDDIRVLLIHPAIKDHITEVIMALNGAMSNCECGGMDCIVGDLQGKAVKVLARRKWNAMSTVQRLRALQDSNVTDDFSIASMPGDAMTEVDGGDLAYELNRD
jgi:hypothetical protein